MSVRSTIMPPSSVNSGSGGRNSRSARQAADRRTAAAPARVRPARRPRVPTIVGMTGIGAQVHLGIFFQDLDRFGTGLQKSRTQRGVRPVADDLLQISLDVRGAVGSRDRGRVARVGYPDRSRRQRRCAADKFRFLTSSVLAPRIEENSAADIPAAPAPMTTTS